ncbi:hypothetical protein BKA70DRAFT_1350132 [Coprinopsis sp. MPI-PUGE-AT-0042]|nr:hypothetical protein BKA70DRAFT_1350132 [Coprinopsis sp. MPI-PUGE-AT-0042]
MVAGAEELEVVLTAAELDQKVIYLLGFWLEALLYGLYLCLFVATIVVFAREDLKRPFASKVFLGGNTLMFILISMHNILNGYRLVVGFAFQIDARAPVTYLNDISNWVAYSLPILLSMVIWIGDALVIYRCFLIWQRSFWVIAIPLLLFFSLLVSAQVANFWWTRQQRDVRHIQGGRWPVLNLTFPLYFTQNGLTTGLILFKIWSRYKRGKAAGLAAPLDTPSLISIMRIIIESAALYTALMLVMVVLCALDHPFRLLIHCILVPTVGITFTLMAFRMHTVREEAKNIHASASLMPPWLLAEREDTSPTPSLTEPHADIPGSTGTENLQAPAHAAALAPQGPHPDDLQVGT